MSCDLHVAKSDRYSQHIINRSCFLSISACTPLSSELATQNTGFFFEILSCHTCVSAIPICPRSARNKRRQPKLKRRCDRVRRHLGTTKRLWRSPVFFGFHRWKGRRPKSWRKSSAWQRRKPCARRKKRSKRRRRRAARRWADAFAIFGYLWEDGRMFVTLPKLCRTVLPISLLHGPSNYIRNINPRIIRVK